MQQLLPLVNDAYLKIPFNWYKFYFSSIFYSNGTSSYEGSMLVYQI